jgi:hypothetical protein
MARLRVGDIEIDGSNITIGGVPQIPAAPNASTGMAMTTTPKAITLASSPRTPDGLDALANVPFGHRLLVGAGGGLVAVAVTLLAVTQVVAAVPLLFTGIGVVVVGLLKRRALGRQAAARTRAEAQELGDHAARLRPLLGEAKPEQTVEWIAERSGLPEEAVVRTLVFMRDRHEAVEELNTETGEWYYGLPLALPAASRDLDERLAALEQGDRKQ